MAEQSTRIADADSGDRISTRDAIESDAAENSRVVQLNDWATRRHGWTQASPTRSGVNSNDSTVLTTVPTAIVNNKLTVGDGQLLVVAVQAKVDTISDSVTITPIVLDNTDAAVAILTPKVFQGFQVAEGGDAFYLVDGTDNYNVCPVQAWDVMGADYIGLHVFLLDSTNTIANVWGAIVSGMPDDHIPATWPTGGSWSMKITTAE